MESTKHSGACTPECALEFNIVDGCTHSQLQWMKSTFTFTPECALELYILDEVQRRLPGLRRLAPVLRLLV